ncbi:SPRY domain-containing SOCS box protein 4-like [Homalodisca vitripennis]|uniref:SPRY domain-containing SOCS box protein 4-like n=1 Tax=Homalodisca vitripennis TaxID=197043 RepID=UPI001EECB5E3|nr:SPRY domain-containing SOCS box protein 4-like [Homalodisca vitripennis]
MALITEPQHYVSLRSVQQLAVPIRLRAVLNCPVDSLQDHERKALNSHGHFHNITIKGLVGNDDQSWGWDVAVRKLFHDSQFDEENGQDYPSPETVDETYTVPENILVVLDMQEGNLSFYIDGFCLGIAFCGLKGKTLYPTISSVFPNCQISIKYIGPCDCEYY